LHGGVWVLSEVRPRRAAHWSLILWRSV